MIPPTIIIEAKTLPEAWQKLVNEVMEKGVIIPSQYTNTKDVCAITTITHPFEEPLLHPDFPTKEIHFKEYLKQFERDYDWKGRSAYCDLCAS